MLVILSKDAQKQYAQLSKKEQIKILKKLKSIEENSTSGKKLTGQLSRIRSLRAWPYRILYEINEKEKRVEIHKIAHRQGVYNR